MSTNIEYMTTAELLETAERLFSLGETNMYRASVLEAITALEASVRIIAFPALEKKVGVELTKWIEDKTRMDFDTRLSVIIPLATGLKVDKTDKLWSDYKRAKDTRNKVTHAGTKVTQAHARFVINTVYEWIEYLKQATEGSQDHSPSRPQTISEVLGSFIQASARLERVIYSVVQKYQRGEGSRRRTYPIEELYTYDLIDQKTLQELQELRNLRNQAVHSPNIELIGLSTQHVQRLNQLVDEIESKL